MVQLRDNGRTMKPAKIVARCLTGQLPQEDRNAEQTRGMKDGVSVNGVASMGDMFKDFGTGVKRKSQGKPKHCQDERNPFSTELLEESQWRDKE